MAPLFLAGLLSVGTSKRPDPATPPPPPAGPSTADAQGDGSGTRDMAPSGRGVDPGVGAHGPTARRPLSPGMPELPPHARALPDGVFHGYLYTTEGARQCGAEALVTGAYQLCAVDRGRLMGCGSTRLSGGFTVFCQGEVFQICQVDAEGRLQSCDVAYSGWTVTERRGTLRRCCIHGGQVKYCTNDEDYICTAADRRPPPRPLPRAQPAPLPPPSGPLAPAPQPRRGSWQRCEIFNGQVSHCRGWYHGEAVVLHDGAYRLCRIFNGQISSCGSWHQGEAVAHRDGAYRLCRIFNGQISSCGSWYRGEAPVFRSE